MLTNHVRSFNGAAIVFNKWPVKATRRNSAFIVWYFGQMAGSGRLALVSDKLLNIYVLD